MFAFRRILSHNFSIVFARFAPVRLLHITQTQSKIRVEDFVKRKK